MPRRQVYLEKSYNLLSFDEVLLILLILPVYRILRPPIENVILVVLNRARDRMGRIKIGGANGHPDAAERLLGPAEAPPVDARVHVGHLRVQVLPEEV